MVPKVHFLTQGNTGSASARPKNSISVAGRADAFVRNDRWVSNRSCVSWTISWKDIKNEIIRKFTAQSDSWEPTRRVDKYNLRPEGLSAGSLRIVFASRSTVSERFHSLSRWLILKMSCKPLAFPQWIAAVLSLRDQSNDERLHAENSGHINRVR
jgi:hypothetical protein